MRVLVKVSALYCFLLLVYEIQADEVEATKLDYPYMAFLYYPDETVTHQGSRFFQSAILIKEDKLISAAIETGNDTFPIKTLAARVGAVVVDGNFTLSEDEDEQESEIIEVILPYKYSSSKKWSNDICILRTLTPFNNTDYVKPIRQDFIEMDKNADRSCKILAFVRKHPSRSTRHLITIGMELSTECGGPKFDDDLMVCGNEESKNYTTSNDFCLDNSGGPLICNDKFVGIQNYIEGEACQPPRLFQLTSAWHKFINCALINCHEECHEMCKVIPKDEPTETSTWSSIGTEDMYAIKLNKPALYQMDESKEDTPFRAKDDDQLTALDTKADIHEKYKEYSEDTSKATTTTTEDTTVTREDTTTTTNIEYTDVTEPPTTTHKPVNETFNTMTQLRQDSRKMGSSGNINFIEHIILSPIILKFLI